MIGEILSVVKILQSKIYINKDITNKFSFKEGDKVVWYINENNELVLSKSDKINYKKTSSSDIETIYRIKQQQ